MWQVGINPDFGGSIEQVSAGVVHSCAVRTAGTVACWGDDSQGQLGLGAAPAVGLSRPVGPSSVTLSAAPNKVVAGGLLGEAYTCALLANSEVECWGDFVYGIQGSTATADRSSPGPVAVRAPTETFTITDIVAGATHVCVLMSDQRTVRCWGDNRSGQLGNQAIGVSNRLGDNEDIYGFSAKVVADNNPNARVTAIASAPGASHTCAIVESGLSKIVRCWGAGGGGSAGRDLRPW